MKTFHQVLFGVLTCEGIHNNKYKGKITVVFENTVCEIIMSFGLHNVDKVTVLILNIFRHSDLINRL